MNRPIRHIRRWMLILLLVIAVRSFQLHSALGSSPGLPTPRDVVDQYCIDCHHSDEPEANLALDTISTQDVQEQTQVWEKVVRKLRGRQMPPPGQPRPDDQTYDAVVATLVNSLDAVAAQHPRPGRTETFRRLTRIEYQNAIRDLLALEVDVTLLLPKDESSYGFDNVTVGDLSPTLLDRYISAAQVISRLAVGGTRRIPDGTTIRIRPDLTQEEHVEGLPLGTRGGAVVPYNVSQDGEYDVQIRLARDRDEHVEGLNEPHDVELLLDRQRIELFTVKPPVDGHDHHAVDENLNARIQLTAGPHQLSVTFLKNPSSLLETKRQPYQAHFNRHRHPRISPAIYQITITGPYASQGHGDTPSRRQIYVCQPSEPSQEESCARRILATLMRRAYRRPVNEADLQGPMKFYRQARAEGDFDAGIELALAGVLVSPEFLFRIEHDPAGVARQSAYPIGDLELASRLSFFLWSSIPDDELLDAAARGDLKTPDELEKQVHRMLADARSQAMVTNFAAQWLHLRNLDAVSPDLRLFPDFDDNLRRAFRRETELLFESVLREDRSVLDLLQADHTFLNERLAKHYGIPHVYGSRFRRVSLSDESQRGGLLRQGSVLTVTSYATRTSPVIRGKWILENLLGMPPPPPPPDVPALTDNTVSASLSVRQRLAEHRANPACAGCHRVIDPVGFALENYDAVGRWRTREVGEPIDASGGLPDGTEFADAAGLEQGLLKHPEFYVDTLAEKLLTFALGRGVEPDDGPAIRKIVRQARAQDFRLSALIMGVVTSTPFQMRTSR
jgi:hypothetical protein